MALITEDGTGKADAESLCSVADASTYHSNRGNAAWAALASDEIREQCLRKATDYMQQVYREQWKGWRTSFTQALDWPRQSVIIRDYPLDAVVLLNIVPPEIKNACAELALKAATETLAPDLARTESEVAVGPLKVKYDSAAPEYKRYRAIDMLLSPFLLHGGGAMHRLVRG